MPTNHDEHESAPRSLRNLLDEYDGETIDLAAVLDLERSIGRLIRAERRKEREIVLARVHECLAEIQNEDV